MSQKAITIFSFVLILAGLASPSASAMCAFRLKDAAVLTPDTYNNDQDAPDWHRFLKESAQKIYDEKTASRSFKAFIERVINRSVQSTEDSGLRRKIILRAIAEGQQLVAQKLMERKSEFESIDEQFQYAKDKINARNKLSLKIASEVLEEIEIDRIIWQEVMPYIKELHERVEVGHRHFDRMILMMKNIIERELDKSSITQPEERERLLRHFLKKSAAALPERIATDVERFGFHETGRDYAKQRDRILESVKRDINLYSLSWKRIAPQTALAGQQLSGDELVLFNRVIAELMQRTHRQSMRWTEADSSEAAMKKIDPLMAEALPLLIKAELKVFQLANSKEAKEEQLERVIQATHASNRMALTPGAPQLTELQQQTDPEEFLIFVRYFPHYLRALQQRRLNRTGSSESWETAIEPTLGLYYNRVLQARAEIPIQSLLQAAAKENPYDGVEYAFLTEDAYYFTALDEIDPLWMDLYESLLHPDEKKIFLQFYGLFKSWTDSRVIWFADSQSSATALEHDLLKISFPALQRVIQNEVQNYPEPSSDLNRYQKNLRLRLQRMRKNFRAQTPLTESELNSLPDNFRSYRAQLSTYEEQIAFDLSVSHLISHHIGRLKLKPTELNAWISAKENFYEEVFPVFASSFEEALESTRLNQIRSGVEIAYRTYTLTLKALGYEDSDLSATVLSQMEQLVSEHLRDALENPSSAPPRSVSPPRPSAEAETETERSTRRLSDNIEFFFAQMDHIEPQSLDQQREEMNAIVQLETQILSAHLASAQGQASILALIEALESKPVKLRAILLKPSGSDRSELNADEEAQRQALLMSLRSFEGAGDDTTKTAKLLEELLAQGVARTSLQIWVMQPLLDLYREDIGDFQLLTRVSPQSLEELIDKKQDFASKNIGLIALVLKQINPFYISREELISAGSEALVHAVDKYEPRTGINFSTFATHLIRNAMLRTLERELARSQSTTSTNLRQRREIDQAISKFWNENAQPPSLEELAEITGISVARIHEINVSRYNFSMDRPTQGGDDDSSRSRLIGTERDQRVGDFPGFHLNQEDRELLLRLIQRLRPRDQGILRQRFGLETSEGGMTLREISEQEGLSRSRIGQIQEEAFEALAIVFYDEVVGFDDSRIMEIATTIYGLDELGQEEGRRSRPQTNLSREQYIALIERAVELGKDEMAAYFSLP